MLFCFVLACFVLGEVGELGVYRVYSMDKRQCQRCCVVKALEDFKDTNKYCERCLEKEREKYQKNREKKRERWQQY